MNISLTILYYILESRFQLLILRHRAFVNWCSCVKHGNMKADNKNFKNVLRGMTHEFETAIDR